jgi:antitoxin MazE
MLPDRIKALTAVSAPLYHCNNVRVRIHRIGNSQGVILPKPLLAQIGLTGGEAEMTVEQDAIVLRRPKKRVRRGWAEEAKALAAAGEDALVLPEFVNQEDRDLEW